LLSVVPAEAGVGDLSGVEETSAVGTGDGSKKHALRNTGDEIAHGLDAVEGRQVLAVDLPGVHRGEELAFALGAGLLEGVIPGGAAASDGGVGVGGGVLLCCGHTILLIKVTLRIVCAF